MKKILSNFNGTKNELIPILQKTQEKFGYISKKRLAQIATFLNITESAVYSVVTFYSQFYLTRQGKYKIRVCQGTACHVLGGPKVLDAVERELGIKAGETTEDHKFGIETVACFGSCALAPVMVVDKTVYGRMTPAKARKILEQY